MPKLGFRENPKIHEIHNKSSIWRDFFRQTCTKLVGTPLKNEIYDD